jgi:RNA polymerase sigma-70 factor (ECF subfamily)
VATPSPQLRLVVGGGQASDERAPRFDDSQLLAAVRAGDAKAANALYTRARPIVDRTIRKLLGRLDRDAQDIFQQAMVEIVRTIGKYRGDCPFDAWIHLLTARVVYKSLRDRQVERRVLADTSPPDVVGVDEPAHRTLLRSTIERVKRHLAGIDSNRRWAFLLHDVHGYDLREMAQIMGTTVSAAQSRLVRGRKDVQQRLAADPELADELQRREGER